MKKLKDFDAIVSSLPVEVGVEYCLLTSGHLL